VLVEQERVAVRVGHHEVRRTLGLLVRGGCPEHAAPGFGRLKGMQKGGSSGQNSAYPTSLPMIIPEAYEYRRYQSGGRRGG
jgi:hypothetical protein